MHPHRSVRIARTKIQQILLLLPARAGVKDIDVYITFYDSLSHTHLTLSITLFTSLPARIFLFQQILLLGFANYRVWDLDWIFKIVVSRFSVLEYSNS
ncbi:unnamed protein product [Lactuca virosa]|uniref:Uncharacterized protein n=1 Tax=Lactuca virosa TaxID=75947 RepID=A0AAU9NZ98_9ASTR|nr:unnamed protein product [Lactuca virosa]